MSLQSRSPSTAIPSAIGMVEGAGIGLEAMREGVHARCRRSAAAAARPSAPGRGSPAPASSSDGRSPSWCAVARLVITPARPTSEPVPAVVGTATTGAIPAGSARVHQSPMSSKSHIGRVCPRMKAMTLPQSSAEPPPKATTPSCPPVAQHLEPGGDVGLGRVGLHVGEDRRLAARRPARPTPARAAAIGSGATPGSVTKSGRAIPAARRRRRASSSMRPAPKRMAVG